MAKIANVALTNTFDTWRTRSNQAFDRLSQFAINNSSLYANTLTANVSFTSKGSSTLGDSTSDLTTITGRATVGTNLAVTGNTSTNKLVVTSLLTSSGNTTTNKLTVSSATTTSNLTISGTTTDNSDALNQTLSDGSTINWNVALGRVATVTIAASRTMAAPTNLKVGTYILKVVQGGSGSYNITWNGLFKWTAQTAPTLSTAVGAVDVFSFFSDGSKLYGSFLPDVR